MKSLQSAILVLAFSATVFLAYTYFIKGENPVASDSSAINNTGFLKAEREFKEDTKYAVRNLKRYVADMNGMDETIKSYDKPIAAIEAMLKRIEQDQIAAEVAISDEKAEELGVMLLDLDERLGVEETDMFEEEELRQILSSELGNTE